MRQVNLGLVGCGTVGGGVLRALEKNGRLMASRLGVQLRLRKIAVKNPRGKRTAPLPKSLLCSHWREIVRDEQIDLVLELMGGTTTARSVILEALRAGKSVITANKALLAGRGEELFATAQQFGANLYYEASVGGGIPIIKVLREALVGNRFLRIYGIVNGTCNFLLSRMKEEKAAFADVLAEARQLGYAEADASLDIDGHDAAHKVGILASLAYGFWVKQQQVYVEGIRGIDPLDIQFADQLGYTIKLLGIVKKPDRSHGGGARRGACAPIQASVYPTLIPNQHVLASVNHVFNAILVRGDIVGDTLYYGRGAGDEATASAVLSDLADAALDLKSGAKNRIPPFVPHEAQGSVLPMAQVVSRYYLRLRVIDRPGTLAKIAAVFAALRIGISSVIQPEGHEGESVPLILMLHDANHAAMTRALKRISRLEVVKAKPVLYRVEHFE